MKIGGNHGYSGNDNRTFCKENAIEISFTQKCRTGKNEVKNATKREFARVRATTMEDSFCTQKEHYGLRRIAAGDKIDRNHADLLRYPYCRRVPSGMKRSVKFGS